MSQRGSYLPRVRQAKEEQALWQEPGLFQDGAVRRTEDSLPVHPFMVQFHYFKQFHALFERVFP